MMVKASGSATATASSSTAVLWRYYFSPGIVAHSFDHSKWWAYRRIQDAQISEGDTKMGHQFMLVHLHHTMKAMTDSRHGIHKAHESCGYGLWWYGSHPESWLFQFCQRIATLFCHEPWHYAMPRDCRMRLKHRICRHFRPLLIWH